MLDQCSPCRNAVLTVGWSTIGRMPAPLAFHTEYQSGLRIGILDFRFRTSSALPLGLVTEPRPFARRAAPCVTDAVFSTGPRNRPGRSRASPAAGREFRVGRLYRAGSYMPHR